VQLRPIRPDDAGALTAFHERLSPETTYQRFFTVMPHLSPDWARILANVDHDRRAAIVAAGPDGGLVGVAHGWDAGSDDAAIALVVQDAWQTRGLGTILLAAHMRTPKIAASRASGCTSLPTTTGCSA
jgi:GNAT superfamily N-acetyltransferase